MTKFEITYTDEYGSEIESEFHWDWSVGDCWGYALQESNRIGSHDFSIEEV